VDPFLNQPQFLNDFREGKGYALDRVYRLYKRPLRNFILRGFSFRSEGRQMYFAGTYAESDVEDILHETFRRAFGPRARSTYDGVRPYKNYLFTIARNCVITDLSQRQRQIPVGEALMRDAPREEQTPLETWVRSQHQADRDDAFDLAAQVENLEIYGLLMAYLESLDAEERRFFQVRFLGMCSQERTARRLGWNRARVRKLETRLRKGFLTHVRGSGYLEMRSEGRKVRRPDDPGHHAQVLARSRAIWRRGRAERDNEFLLEAA